MEWVFLIWMLGYPIMSCSCRLLYFASGYYGWMFEGNDKSGTMAMTSFIEVIIYFVVGRIIWSAV